MLADRQGGEDPWRPGRDKGFFEEGTDKAGGTS